MLNQQSQQAIRQAIRRAVDTVSGIAHAGEFRNHLLALLVVKYLSAQEISRLSSLSVSSTKGDTPAFEVLLGAAQNATIGAQIDETLTELEHKYPELQGVFQDIRFESAALGNAEQRPRALAHLLRCFETPELDFRGDFEQAHAAVAFACDVLIQDMAVISGRRGLDFFTPPAVSALIARLMQPKPGESVCDPCCGSGNLLLTCSTAACVPTGAACQLYGQEKNGSTWAMAKMSMLLHGHAMAHMALGDTLQDPKLLLDGRLRTFDVVVSSPPFGVKAWGQERAAQDAYGRYRYGIPPRAAADYAFLSHMVAAMKPDTGRMAAAVSLGVLFRGGAEQAIREQLLREGLIDAVIALPPNLYTHTGLPVALLVLKRQKTDEQVLFIDASRDCEHGKTQNSLRDTDVARIEATYRARQSIAGFAQLVPLKEILHNGCTLSVARYVEALEETQPVDAVALRAERAALKAELAELEAKLEAMLPESNHD